MDQQKGIVRSCSKIIAPGNTSIRIVGFDHSIRATGIYGVSIGDGRIKEACYGRFGVPDKRNTRAERLAAYQEIANQRIREAVFGGSENLRIVVLEYGAFAGRAWSLFNQGEVRGIIATTIFSLSNKLSVDIEITEINPTTLKRVVGGSGKANKETMKRAVCESDHNIADAKALVICEMITGPCKGFSGLPIDVSGIVAFLPCRAARGDSCIHNKRGSMI